MQIWEVIASLANWNCSERDSGEFLSWWKSSIFCFLWKLPWAYKTENSFTWKFKICYSCCSVPKLCLTLCHPVDHSLPGPYADLSSDFAPQPGGGAGPSPDTEFWASSALKGNRQVLLRRDRKGQALFESVMPDEWQISMGDLISFLQKEIKKIQSEKNFRLH